MERYRPRRGIFKYKCEDCAEITWLSYSDRSSRFRPRCQFCGSTWLVECTEYAAAYNSNARIEAKEQRRSRKAKQLA